MSCVLVYYDLFVSVPPPRLLYPSGGRVIRKIRVGYDNILTWTLSLFV
jgi:hypothetical protein